MIPAVVDSSNLLSHQYYEYLYRDLTLSDDQERSIAEAIRHNDFLACSDGSYDPVAQVASYGLVGGTYQSSLLRTNGPCPGHPSQLSAICSELCSINAAVKLFLYIYSKYDIKAGMVTLFNDCEKAHKLLPKPGRKFRRFLMDHYDIISETCHAMQELRGLITLQLLWVKGHYPGKNREIQHDLNDAAHRLAVSALESFTPMDVSPPSTMVALSCGYTISSHWQPLLLELSHGANLCQTICKNAWWSEDTFHKVDWPAMQSCMSQFSRVQQIAYGKLLHGILNTNVQNNKFYNHLSLCPVCLAEPEFFLHVVTCTHPETVQHQSDQQLTLWKALTGIQTHPVVLVAIRSVIIDDAHDNDSTLNSTASVHSSMLSRSASPAFELMIQVAVHQQIIELGREQFYRGRVSLLWREAAYLESLHLGIGLDKQRWSSGMVYALLRYSLALWRF
jgi:hypothetical protein